MTKEDLAEKVKTARQRYALLRMTNILGKSELERIILSIDSDEAWETWQSAERELREMIKAERIVERAS